MDTIACGAALLAAGHPDTITVFPAGTRTAADAAADDVGDAALFLGDDGWELVSITSINFKTGATDHIGMVFKREKRVS